MDDTKTCGELYLDVLKRFTDMDPAKIELFVPGWVAGQVEMVYSGACAAAMFRPSKEYWGLVVGAICDACVIYGLAWDRLGLAGKGELWVLNYDHAPDTQSKWQHVRTMLGSQENTPTWHALRGSLCGIRREDIDILYHERPEFGKRCD